MRGVEIGHKHDKRMTFSRVTPGHRWRMNPLSSEHQGRKSTIFSSVVTEATSWESRHHRHLVHARALITGLAGGNAGRCMLTRWHFNKQQD